MIKSKKLLTGSIKRFVTNSANQTQEIAKKLAMKVLESKNSQKAVILALRGDLGAGKTTFLQGFALGLGIIDKVNSPTFVIMKRFNLTKFKNQNSKIKMTIQNVKVKNFKNFYHFDCYRLNNSKEILDLGFKEIISNPENIVAIEWPEKIKKFLPKNSLKIKFKHLEEGIREIEIDNF